MLNVTGMLGLAETRELKAAAAAPEPPALADMTDSATLDAKLLFSLLVATCRGKAAVIVNLVRDGHGKAACHLLLAEYQPRLADSQTALCCGRLKPLWPSSQTAVAIFSLDEVIAAMGNCPRPVPVRVWRSCAL